MSVTYTCDACAIRWVESDGATCPGCRRSCAAPQLALHAATRRLLDEIERTQRSGRTLVAEAEREDAQVTETRPQRYRWTRYATVEALTRYASTSRRCERAGCENRITGDNSRERYCSRTCANTESFARRGGRAKR